MSTPSGALAAEKQHILELGNQSLCVRLGSLALQANASVLCQMGETISLANCTVSPKPREGIDFLPLQVVYQEKYYAGGKIAGSRFRKREGRPHDDFVLLGRVIDRGLRPMFPKHLRHDVQIFCTVLSYDFVHEHDVVSANAANLAVALSDCPCEGPLGSVRVGMIGGELVLNPSREARMRSDLDLFLTASVERVVMIEAGAKEVSEAEILRAIAFGKRWAQKIAWFFAELEKQSGKPKLSIAQPFMHEEGYASLKGWVLPMVTRAIRESLSKQERRRIFDQLMEQAGGKLQETFGITDGKATTGAMIEAARQMEVRTREQFGVEAALDLEREVLYGYAAIFIDTIIKEEVRRLILEEGVRMGGRRVDEIRPISIVIDPLPSFVHGSALFQRGETQALTTCTLGAPGDRLIVEGMEGEEKLRYFHHYNFPPFSIGETSNRLAIGNREIGHGNLAQRGIEPVLPAEEAFPYTIRTVTEILSSNGSTSMAATCGSTLALMAAGVPITTPVAGVALGLVSHEEKGKYVILSDLQDEEDFGGDMDFKVAGTEKGVTAIQMDIKIKGLPDHVLAEALDRARLGRLHILEIMRQALPEPRKELSPHAPRIDTLQVNPEDIRLVIGRGGETIQKITAELGVEIDIEDSGLIYVTAKNADAMQRAKEWILGIVEKPEVGKVYDAKVTRIIPNVGAIVEFLRGKDGMVHISELQWQRTERVEDVVNVGDELKVKVVEYDPIEGRTRLSLRQMSVPPPEGPAGLRPPHPGGHHRPHRGHSHGGRHGPHR
jgi:polyribonucleotide nucleotidyltransferase